MTTNQVLKSLDIILKFMEPYWPWVNCHMVNFITDKHWQEYVPIEIQKELSDGSDCIESVFWCQTASGAKKFPNLMQFLAENQKHYVQNMPDILTTKETFEQNILNIEHEHQQEQISIKEFLTEKKRHEVEITARLVNDLIKATLPEDVEAVIVDAGDGKGYLSSRLALEYGHKVLGIDSNVTNTENALERNKKLKKAWNALTERAKLESKGITPTKKGKRKQCQNSEPSTIQHSSTDENYKTVEKFITGDLEITKLIKNTFPNFLNNEPAICLTGLHTCGNLASTCLKLFHSQNNCKLLCNIGCCYHLLKEMHSGQEFFGNKHISSLNQDYGFPLSQYLNSKQVKLGRNARMLAVQSLERTKCAKSLPNISLHYRALLEVLVCEINPELSNTVHVGKIKKFNNFGEYVKLCMQKHPQLNISNERIEAVVEECQEYKNLLDLFYLLRMSFAPIVESLILLDRLMFLKECGYQKSYLVPAFDAVVSPRRFALIAIKE